MPPGRRARTYLPRSGVVSATRWPPRSRMPSSSVRERRKNSRTRLVREAPLVGVADLLLDSFHEPVEVFLPIRSLVVHVDIHRIGVGLGIGFPRRSHRRGAGGQPRRFGQRHRLLQLQPVADAGRGRHRKPANRLAIDDQLDLRDGCNLAARPHPDLDRMRAFARLVQNGARRLSVHLKQH